VVTALSKAESSNVTEMLRFTESLVKFRMALNMQLGSPAQASALAREQFSSTSRSAALGDVGALGDLQGVITQFLDASKTNSRTQLEYARDLALANIALGNAIRYTAGQAGIPVPGFADGGMHRGGWRMVGERGPELEYTPPSRIFSSAQSSNIIDITPLLDEMKMMRADLNVMRVDTRKTADTLIRVTRDGANMVTVAA